jgi:hypothetical protein
MYNTTLLKVDSGCSNMSNSIPVKANKTGAFKIGQQLVLSINGVKRELLWDGIAVLAVYMIAKSISLRQLDKSVEFRSNYTANLLGFLAHDIDVCNIFS